MQQEAVKKITDGMQDCQEKRVPAEPIARFLTEKCGGDGDFCALVMQEHKTLEKCFAFVYEQAKNHLDSAGGWIEDNDVYMMAIDYFSLDDAELERQKAEEEAKRAEERRKEDEERQQRINEAKAQKARAANPEQLSLFDGGQVN